MLLMLGVFPGNHSYHTTNVTVGESVGEPTHKSAAPCWLNVTSVLPYTVNNYYQFPTCHCHISPHSKLPPPTAWSTPPDSIVFFLCEGGGSWLSFFKSMTPLHGPGKNWKLNNDNNKKNTYEKKKKNPHLNFFVWKSVTMKKEIRTTKAERRKRENEITQLGMGK